MDGLSSEALELGLNPARPTVLHVDINCAFASIEQQDNRGIRGLPVVVGAYVSDPSTIISASREARALGIRTGMRVREARAIRRDVVVLEPRPERYREVAAILHSVLERRTPTVILKSIDEATAELAGTPDLARFGPEAVARAVKADLAAAAGECITCSVGISTSGWMAKQASNLKKPDGLERIDHRNLVQVLGRLQLIELTGIGAATEKALRRAGILTPIGFLRAPVPQLKQVFGAVVAEAWRMRLRGHEVGGFEAAPPKSFSNSHVIIRPTADPAELDVLLMRLSFRVAGRMRRDGWRGRVVSVSVAHRDGRSWGRQMTLARATNASREVLEAARSLMSAREAGFEVGTLGVGMTQLTPAARDQMDLFDAPVDVKADRVEAAMDVIRARFGDHAVQVARLAASPDPLKDRIAFGNTGHSTRPTAPEE